jgi:copper(I)-binding protein
MVMINMRLKSFALAITMLVFAGLDAGATSDAPSGSPSDSQLSFSPMQMRATAPGMPSSAAYVSIANHGDAADRLIAAKTVVAQRVEIHLMEMDNGVMRMRAVDGSLPIAAGGSVHLAPGGLHIMLMGLTTQLAAESQHEITLMFEKAGEITLTATVKRPADITSTMPGHDLTIPGHKMSHQSQ